jgi:hypothetical protein
VVLISIAVAILAGFFASTHPDGLEKVAANLGFEHKAVPTPGVFVHGIKYLGRLLKNLLNFR